MTTDSQLYSLSLFKATPFSAWLFVYSVDTVFYTCISPVFHLYLALGCLVVYQNSKKSVYDLEFN